MAYPHQLHHLNLHKKHEMEKIVPRQPQKSDTKNNGNGGGGSSGDGNRKPERNNGNSDAQSDAQSDASSDTNTAIATNTLSNVFSVVWITASPTFTGEVAGYTTLTPSAAESSREQSGADVVTQPQNIEASSSQEIWTPASSSEVPADMETTAQAPPPSSWQVATTSDSSPPSSAAVVVDLSLSSSSSTTPSSPTPPPPPSDRSSTLPTSIAVAASSSTLLSSYIPHSRTSSKSLSPTTPSSTATAVAVSSSSAGMSPGGKAGLAIGIILIVALLAGGALWFISKRKKGNGGWQKADDEKLGFGAAEEAEGKNVRSPVVAPLAKHGSSAPRLSLRPVTQFIPDLAAAKKRLSRGNPLDTKNKPAGMAAAGPERTLTHDQNGSLWERRAGDNPPNPFKDPANPFADQTRALPPPPPSVTVTPPVSDDGSGTEAAAGVVAGAVAAEAPMVAAAGKSGSGQVRNGPVGPEAAHVGAGAPPASNVHRVQLDFKPSMDDELELCTGQLVRVLHEYDDGWALCIRLDRSQQGVAPRTCLSARPVKPRPTNGSPRMGPKGRPISPAQLRPLSPAGGAGPRPKSPASSHGPSPGTANGGRALSPPGQGPPPMMLQRPNPTAPGQFNQAPRPLSPGPVARSPQPQTRLPQRSQSPGPYGARPGPTPMITNQRRRSNSASAIQARRASPPGSSPLARGDPMAGWRPPKPQNNLRSMPGVAF